MTRLVLLLILTIAKIKVESTNIEKKVVDYFASEHVKLFHDVWSKYRQPMEDAVQKSLQDTLGSPSGVMNVYVKHDGQSRNLEKGFYFTDNVVNVLLQNLFLRELPRLESPDVSFPLEHNVIRIESRLSKIFADAGYVLFRNRSDIVYEGPQNVLRNSPFSFQQVQTSGFLTIIGEDCHLTGQAVVTLSGVSLHVGHSTFKLNNCKFSIEIYQPGSPSPPVIAPYFNKEQCVQLEEILSNPIADEVHTELQGILISHVNTTALFGTNMPKFRRRQKYIFQDVADFMTLVTRQLNQDNLVQNQGVVSMDGTELAWDDALSNEGSKSDSYLTVSDVTVNGLDRLYYSRHGGPILTGDPAIEDQLRFEQLQVRGKLLFKGASTSSSFDFGVEIKDVLVYVKIELINEEGQNENDVRRKGNDMSQDSNSYIRSDSKDDTSDDEIRKLAIGRSRSVSKFKIKGWRSLEFTTIDKSVILPSYAFITGYLVNELAPTILKHLEHQFSQSVEQAEKYRNTVEFEKVKKVQVQVKVNTNNKNHNKIHKPPKNTPKTTKNTPKTTKNTPKPSKKTLKTTSKPKKTTKIPPNPPKPKLTPKRIQIKPKPANIKPKPKYTTKKKTPKPTTPKPTTPKPTTPKPTTPKPTTPKPTTPKPKTNIEIEPPSPGVQETEDSDSDGDDESSSEESYINVGIGIG